MSLRRRVYEHFVIPPGDRLPVRGGFVIPRGGITKCS